MWNVKDDLKSLNPYSYADVIKRIVNITIGIFYVTSISQIFESACHSTVVGLEREHMVYDKLQLKKNNRERFLYKQLVDSINCRRVKTLQKLYGFFNILLS